MKFLHKIFLGLAMMGMVSCNVFDLDPYLENPNAVSPEDADVSFLYNNIQLSMAGIYNSTWGFAGGTSRMIAATGAFNYQSAYTPTGFNGIWNAAYAGIIPDIDAMIPKAEEIGLDIHVGSAKIMKAYTLLILVDMFGDVPYSEAFQGTEVISPVRDADADVYAAAEALLDEAIADLSDTEASAPAVDIFYDGDPAKWLALANTLKLRIAVTTRLTDGGAAGKINALLDQELIDEASEDWTFKYGNNRNNPNSRHPFYNSAYESDDADYQSNYYMWLMVGEKGIEDPRRRFYFYRQDNDLSDEDVDVWSCIYSLEPDPAFRPAHYTEVDTAMPYCIADISGYVGRDHLNGDGIPPDGPIRTLYGLYPAGGRFDADEGAQIDRSDTDNLGTYGALGEGILPMWLSSFTYFLRAEAALTLGTNDDARAMLEQGIQASFDKVRSFESFLNPSRVVGKDFDGNDVTLGQAFLDPLDTQQEDYITFVLDQYDTAGSDDERLDVIMKEYYLALYGNGLEAYNNYRRTGKPENMQPGIQVEFGRFPFSAVYPNDHVTLNQNADQKDPNTANRVFWDDGSATVY